MTQHEIGLEPIRRLRDVTPKETEVERQTRENLLQACREFAEATSLSLADATQVLERILSALARPADAGGRAYPTELGPPTMGDHDDEQRLADAYPEVQS